MIIGDQVQCWRARRDRIRHFSYSEILQIGKNTEKLEALKGELSGKIAMLSETVGNLFDVRSVHTRPQLSSGVIQTLVIQNILTASFLRRLSAIDNVMIELPMLGLLLFMGLRWSSLPLSLGTVALMAAYGLIAVILLVFFGRLEAHFQAARHVAGDFYDVFELPYSKQVALVIADVCDKGVGAALFMALFRNLIRVLSGSYDGAQPVKGPSSGSHPEDTLLRTIRSINTYIARTHERESMFATIFFGILNPHTGDIHYIKAGHEPPIVIGARALKATLSPTGPAVGLFVSLDFEVGEIQLEPGHILLVYTDCVTNAQDEAGRAFSKEQLFSAVVSSYASVEELVHHIRDLLTKHTRGQDQFDDITLLALRRKPT